MGFIRKFAVQAHAVPETKMNPRGPFPLEVLAQNPVVHDRHDSDSLHEALDDERWFRCKLCGDIVAEYHLDNHDCNESEYY